MGEFLLESDYKELLAALSQGARRHRQVVASMQSMQYRVEHRLREPAPVPSDFVDVLARVYATIDIVVLPLDNLQVRPVAEKLKDVIQELARKRDLFGRTTMT